MKLCFIYRSYNRYRVENIRNRDNKKIHEIILARSKFDGLLYTDFARFSDKVLLYIA
jgi:hypothetical protein